MLNSAYVYFGLFGDFDPDQLVREISLAPTSIAKKGSRNSKLDLPRQSCWKYSTDKKTNASIDLYQMADSLVLVLEPFTDEIARAVQCHDLTSVLQAVVHIGGGDEISTPAIGFSRGVLSFVYKTNATIDIDTYLNFGD